MINAKNERNLNSELSPRTLYRLLICGAVSLMCSVLWVAAQAPAASALTQLAAEEGVASISGRITHESDPLEGVEILVTSSSDSSIELMAVTDADGRWSVPLPETGEYEVELIVETLPDGVILREGTTNIRTIDTTLTQSPSVLFATGAGADGSQTASTGDIVVTRLIYGVTFGLLLALAAVGVSLIFGTTGVNNFAQGEIITFGALVFYAFFIVASFSLPVAAVIAVGLTALLGLALEMGLFSPLRRRRVGLVETILVTIALSLILRYTYLFFFGGSTQTVSSHITTVVEVGPASVTVASLISMVISIAVLVVVGLVLGYTRVGRSLRAVRDSAALAQLSGISVNRSGRIVWLIGGAITGLSGVLYSLYRGVSWDMGFAILLLLFASVTLAGIGNLFGSLVGALIIGVSTELSTVVIPADLRYAIALAVLVLCLIFRPQGLFTPKGRVG